MKFNMFVAYYPDTKEVPFIYFEDKETGELVSAEFGGEESYASSDHLKSTVYSDTSDLVAVNTADLSEQEQDRVYTNFVYHPRVKFDFPPMSEVFKGTSWAHDFDN